ncbi:envelope stress response membrane protein PspB [Hahella aquimaris]|uniref:Probable phage shock protein B n=1 Tax=Hahella chejuensis (strain KCTC 2396) TaxID=349521 RepID=Q2SB65_HAHCH|nr:MULTISPECIES: envelope stress response membrane protein PspB [Hahella]ABC32109.1 probable phage shock protein B [Hahella chejuensis KCTC 2396]WLQ14479.1 envelope stress response membrane protein PspB [Hahella sp. HNIBRBA332]
MSSIMVFFFVPTVIFLSLVAPIWLILHYRTKSKIRRSLSEDERDLLESALRTAERLEQRINALETILDADHGGWRTYDNRHDRPQHH